jgi:hypothetical protein
VLKYSISNICIYVLGLYGPIVYIYLFSKEILRSESKAHSIKEAEKIMIKNACRKETNNRKQHNRHGVDVIQLKMQMQSYGRNISQN